MSSGVDKNEIWNPENLKTYLNIYYSDQPDWDRELGKLRKKGKSRDMNRKHLAFTILAPFEINLRPTSPVEALLHACYKFDSFDDQDWASNLERVFVQDQVTHQNRNKFLSMGVIAPVEHHSRSRQALKWVYELAAEDGTITEANKNAVLNRLKSTIMIYGPSAVCSLFQKGEVKASYLMKVPNWRSGYFLERGLYLHNDLDKLLLFKQRDIESAPKELVKHFAEPQEQVS